MEKRGHQLETQRSHLTPQKDHLGPVYSFEYHLSNVVFTTTKKQNNYGRLCGLLVRIVDAVLVFFYRTELGTGVLRVENGNQMQCCYY